jgi:hypothetical protein
MGYRLAQSILGGSSSFLYEGIVEKPADERPKASAGEKERVRELEKVHS